MKRTVISTSVDRTRALAQAIGRSARPGDVIAITGDLGAGKTAFAQGLASGLGIPEGVAIVSPTFTIIAEHPEGRIPLYHFDAYRLDGPEDFLSLGFSEYVDGDGLSAIEWADLVAGALPEDRLSVRIVALDTGDREIELAASGPCSERLLGGSAAL